VFFLKPAHLLLLTGFSHWKRQDNVSLSQNAKHVMWCVMRTRRRRLKTNKNVKSSTTAASSALLLLHFFFLFRCCIKIRKKHYKFSRHSVSQIRTVLLVMLMCICIATQSPFLIGKNTNTSIIIIVIIITMIAHAHMYMMIRFHGHAKSSPFLFTLIYNGNPIKIPAFRRFSLI